MTETYILKENIQEVENLVLLSSYFMTNCSESIEKAIVTPILLGTILKKSIWKYSVFTPDCLFFPGWLVLLEMLTYVQCMQGSFIS